MPDIQKLETRLTKAKEHRSTVGTKGTIAEQRAARKRHKRAARRLSSTKVALARRLKKEGADGAASE